MLEAYSDVPESGGRLVVLRGASRSGRSSVLRAVQETHPETTDILVGTAWLQQTPYALLRQSASGLDLTPPGADLSHSRTVDQITAADVLLSRLPASDQTPRIIAVDDVHLSDPASLQVLTLVARRIRSSAALLVVAVDPETSGALDPDFSRLLSDPMNAPVEIPSLRTDDVTELARRQGMPDIGDHDAAMLLHYSGGRLTVIQEIMASLPEGTFPSDPSDAPLPASVVHEVLRPLLETGSPDLRKLVEALAILGDSHDLERLGHVAATGQGTSHAVDQGISYGVLTERSTAGMRVLEFAHPAAARVVSAEMLPSTRRSLHLRAAETSPEPEERLCHLADAAQGPDPELAAELNEAAEGAERRGRWEDSSRLRFAGVKVLPPSAERDRQLLSGIDALASAGYVTKVLPWLEAGKEVPFSPRRDAVLANVAIHRGKAAEADDLLSRAESTDSGTSDLDAHVALRRTLDALGRWDGQKLCAWAARAMELSDPNEPAYVESLAMRGVGFVAQGQMQDAQQTIDEIARRGALGAQKQRFHLCNGWVLLRQGRLRGAVRELEAAVPTRHERGSMRISLWARGWLARTQYLLGEWDDALRTADKGMNEASAAGIALVEPLLQWTAAEIRLWRGHSPQNVMRHATSGAFLSDYLAMQVPARCTRAVAADARGDHIGRAAALQPLLDVDPWTAERTPFWPWQAELVDALIAVGREREARRAAEQMLNRADPANHYVYALSLSSWARVLGGQGDVARAEETFDEASRLLTQTDDHPTTLARVLLSRGQMLRRANRRREAMTELSRAREFYEGVGATVLVEQCDRELRATGMSGQGQETGVAFREDTDASPQPVLTPQEYAVSDLVAQGMTNVEVAQKLFIAEKTVQYHLTNIYAKFSIRSRTELASRWLGDNPSFPQPPREPPG